MKLKFEYREDCYLRVYYRDGERRYCIQNDGRSGRDLMTFYECTDDGEPVVAVEFPMICAFDKAVFPDPV